MSLFFNNISATGVSSLAMGLASVSNITGSDATIFSTTIPAGTIAMCSKLKIKAVFTLTTSHTSPTIKLGLNFADLTLLPLNFATTTIDITDQPFILEAEVSIGGADFYVSYRVYSDVTSGPLTVSYPVSMGGATSTADILHTDTALALVASFGAADASTILKIKSLIYEIS